MISLPFITRIKVGVFNSGEPVRNHEGGTPLRQLCHGLLYQQLCLGIYRAGRLIKDQKQRIFDHTLTLQS